MAVYFYKIVDFKEFKDQDKYFICKISKIVLKCEFNGKSYGIENCDKGGDFNVKYGGNVKQ